MNLTSKTQIDRLGDRLRKGNPSDDDLLRLDEYRRSFAEAFEEVVSVVRKATELDPTSRSAKTKASIIEKLRRETMRLSQMQDIAGCRVVVQDILAQDKVVAELTAALPNAMVVDRRVQPSHGYRAVHIIAMARGKAVEIQVRTELQDLWAQLSEKLADRIDTAIKYGGGDPESRGNIYSLSSGIRYYEEAELALRLQGQLEKERRDIQQRKRRMAQLLPDQRKKLRQLLEESIAKLEASARKRNGD